MKVLGVDTATSSCSVALVEDGCILAECTSDSNQTHSINLMPMVAWAFEQSNVNLRDLDCFGVVIGPGTFTGLRIGLSTIKGMAYGSNKPVVGINALDALAFPLSRFKRPIVAMLDARRGEVYYACYSFQNGSISSNVTYKVASPKKTISDIPENAFLIGSGAVKYFTFFEDYFDMIKKKDANNLIRASSVAFLAENKFAFGDTDCLATLVPYYIRKPDIRQNM